MKFNNIIIGSGLAGLVCAIKLQQQGQSCAIISNGQSALDFSSGSFDFLANNQQQSIEEALYRLKQQRPNHPYSLIGISNVIKAKKSFEKLSEQIGLDLINNSNDCHFRLSAIGALQPTWLSPRYTPQFSIQSPRLPKKIMVLGINGFNDFHPQLLGENLQRYTHFQDCIIEYDYIEISTINKMLIEARELRSTNIAHVLTYHTDINELVKEISDKSKDADKVFLPACFGLENNHLLVKLRTLCQKELEEVATLPPSILGIRQSITLKQYVKQLGGLIFNDDLALTADYSNNQMTALYTNKHEDIPLIADNYIFATGSFFSKGLLTDYDTIYEPILNLDLLSNHCREQWANIAFEQSHEYQRYGVCIDEYCRVFKDQKRSNNVYAIGSITAENDAMELGCGAGIAIVTALTAAQHILDKRH